MSQITEVLEKKLTTLKGTLQAAWSDLSDDELKNAFEAEVGQVSSQIQEKVEAFKAEAETELKTLKTKIETELKRFQKKDSA